MRSLIYNQHISKVTPHFTFMRRAQNADTHALKQHRLYPKQFPCLLQFCTVHRIWHASRAWKRKTSETRWFSHNKKKNSRYNQHFFAIFRPILINWPPTYFTVVWPVSSGKNGGGNPHKREFPIYQELKSTGSLRRCYRGEIPVATSCSAFRRQLKWTTDRAWWTRELTRQYSSQWQLDVCTTWGPLVGRIMH